MAESTDPDLRDAVFERVRAISERNGRLFPDVTSDGLLEELKRADEERRVPASRECAASSW